MLIRGCKLPFLGPEKIGVHSLASDWCHIMIDIPDIFLFFWLALKIPPRDPTSSSFRGVAVFFFSDFPCFSNVFFEASTTLARLLCMDLSLCFFGFGWRIRGLLDYEMFFLFLFQCQWMIIPCSVPQNPKLWENFD